MTSNPQPPIYELGPDFYDEVEPACFPQAKLRYRNQDAAASVGLQNLSDDQWKEHFWHFTALPKNIQKPLALRYHGHQFRHYNPDLGDGRGFLFAQIQTAEKLLDLGTKGSGQTPYSRNGDGRLTLKGAFREILATELLESYGVNTSKTFSVFETGENLVRHDEPSPTRAGALVRLSHSHIRIGAFQRLAYLKQTENIQKLTDYCVRHYYPHLSSLDGPEKASLFLREVSHALAKTTAQWMMAGFVHGVLNSDNMNITGESFDYGPFRFLRTYDPNFTAAYFDHQGLYCFGRQPTSVLWNLHQLGASLQGAYPEMSAADFLEDFGDEFNFQVQYHLLRRLNLNENPEKIENLLIRLFTFMEKERPLFEQTFFDLHSGLSEERLKNSPQNSLYQTESFQEVRKALEHFTVADKKKTRHPYFQQSRACSLIIDELEALWLPIAEKDDWSPFEQKLQEIRSFRGLY